MITPIPGDVDLEQGLGQGINLDAWGNQKVTMDKSLLHGMFTFEVPQEYWKEVHDGVEQTSFTNAQSVNGELVLTSGALDESIVLDTFRNPRYEPNRGHRYAVSEFLPNPTYRGTRRWGSFTEEAGLFFELIGDGAQFELFLTSRTTIDGVTIDTQNLINPSAYPVGLNFPKGNIYDIQAQMRMVGDFKAFIGDASTGVSKEVEYVRNLNNLDNLSVFNPAMPIAFECINQGDEVTICAGCVDITSEGGEGARGVYGSVAIDNDNGQIGISGLNVPVLVVKNRRTVPVSLLRNTRDTLALLATGYSDQRSILRVWATRDETAITLNDQTWQPFRDGLIEYLQYDNPNVTTPITFDTTKADLIFSSRVDQDQAYSTSALFEGRTDIFQTPGDIFIFTMHRENGQAANVGVTYEFAEEV
jgi:hypothetical protein